MLELVDLDKLKCQKAGGRVSCKVLHTSVALFYDG